VPGKDFARKLWWSFPAAAKKREHKAAFGEEKNGTVEMKFTGTLIEDLVATVERAEQKTQLDGDLAVQVLQLEPLPLEPLPSAASPAGWGRRRSTSAKISTIRAWSRWKTRAARAK